MPKFRLTPNGNVVQCNYSCTQHEHYIGTYENALVYFGVEKEGVKAYGNLMNIMIYHQLSGYTVPKLSNELYDILMSAMAEHKYWVPLDQRKEKALEMLDLAEEKELLRDDLIIASLQKRGKRNDLSRIHAYEHWKKLI